MYVDTVGDAERHRERLAQRFPGIDFTVCPKADAIYPIVSAASIVAKTARDEQLRDFRVPEVVPVQRDFGSGYPGGAMLARRQRVGHGGILKIECAGAASVGKTSWGLGPDHASATNTFVLKECCFQMKRSMEI